MDNKLAQKINDLKRRRRAVIIAHNYQVGEVQDIADFTGDSLELSRKAAELGDVEVVVFCGVKFMAETASILSPDKVILLPVIHAGCPMADMITAPKLLELKRKHPDALVVAYVNTTAEVKAEVDICCTSGNAIKVINSIPRDQKIIFVPDKYLGSYVMKQTGRDMILWNGFCPTHVKILPSDIEAAKKEHPGAVTVSHPECTSEVIAMSDHALSTGQMLSFIKDSKDKEFIIATEPGIIHRLKKENPEKRFYPATMKSICPNMKKITLEEVLWSLEDLKEEIKVPDEIRKRAITPIRRMLEIR